ncbi:hypothetical protein ACLBP5_30405, partial [Klebsiella pneumoniae]
MNLPVNIYRDVLFAQILEGIFPSIGAVHSTGIGIISSTLVSSIHADLATPFSTPYWPSRSDTLT